MKSPATTAVLEVGPILRASQQGTVERVLRRQEGVTGVDVNAVAQTETVRYDPARASLGRLADPRPGPLTRRSAEKASQAGFNSRRDQRDGNDSNDGGLGERWEHER